MCAIAFRHVVNGCDKCFGGVDKHCGGFDKHVGACHKHCGGIDKHFSVSDEHLARIYMVLASIFAPPNHNPAPYYVECQHIGNRLPGSGCNTCFGGFDKHFGGFDKHFGARRKHGGGFDKHFNGSDKHLARNFVVLTRISAPPNHTPAPCCVECQNIGNRLPKDLRQHLPGNGFCNSISACCEWL